MEKILSVDVGHLFSEEDNKNFISLSDYESFSKKYESSFNETKVSLETKDSPITRSFLTDTSLSVIKQISESLRKKYENILLIGIGGSTLGFRAILQFLKGPFYNFGNPLSRNFPRIFVIDNVDPVIAKHLGSLLDFKKTAIIYISKSGSTPEPAANFIYFFKKYKEANGVMKDIVIICDPGNNGINRIAKDLGCYTLYIPPDLPGRYTVLSPVGFLPSELIGVNSRELLDGAIKMHESILNTPIQKNAVFILGACLSELASRGKSIHVLFNYSSLLSEFGLWFIQLWSESLGKKNSITGSILHSGTTPLIALGATDQHSLLQLFKEGPNDKVIGFVTIDKLQAEVTLTDEFPSEVEYSYFSGQKMGDQLKIEQISTEMSLVRANRPCYHLFLPNISAFTLGGLFYFMESLTVFTAKFNKINPYDQPGVEESKNITYSLMGRGDYASLRLQSEAGLSSFNSKQRIFQL